MSGPATFVAEEDQLTERVSERLGRRWQGCRVGSLTTLAGGRSGITYVAKVLNGRADAGGTKPDRVVIKTIPVGMTAVRNRDIVRQGRVVAALHAVGQPVPEPLVVEPGDPPAVPPFLVSRFVEGDSYDPTSRHATGGTAPAGGVTARVVAAAATLARLQEASLSDLEIEDEPRGSLIDEVARWRTALDTTRLARESDVTRCTEALVGTVPDETPAVLVHGDFRLGNLLCRGDNVAAVIDWEIWSVGDARLDLGWFAARFDPTYPTVPTGRPLPDPDLVLDAYGRAGGRARDRLDWFFALAAFKQAAASALIDKRSGGGAGDERALALIRWALGRRGAAAW